MATCNMEEVNEVAGLVTDTSMEIDVSATGSVLTTCQISLHSLHRYYAKQSRYVLLHDPGLHLTPWVLPTHRLHDHRDGYP